MRRWFHAVEVERLDLAGVLEDALEFRAHRLSLGFREVKARQAGDMVNCCSVDVHRPNPRRPVPRSLTKLLVGEPDEG